MSVLTVIDTTGIQSYIFGSNRLRENIGASEIIARATDDWVRKQLKNNVVDDELIYVGGGNTLILFKDKDNALDFTKRYTRFLLANAPGLFVVVAHSEEFTISDNDNCIIRKQHEKGMKLIAEKKSNRKLSTPLLGMAVTAKCTSTGGVASFDPVKAAQGNEEEETLREKCGYSYVSAETLMKLKYVQDANARLKSELLEKNETLLASGIKCGEKWDSLKSVFNLEVPYELDNLGRSEGEASYIAVVHTDGNGMGKRVEAVGKKAMTSREWITIMRSFSKEINDANLNALKATLAHLLERIQERPDKKGNKKLVVDGGHGEEFELSRGKIGKGKRECAFLPFRPLIFGGEDVAFVCDGRIALALTAYYLEKIEEQKLSDPNVLTIDKKSPMYARAGIAIVKSHHPFARAYSLAEDLAKSAKSRINKINEGKTEKDKIQLSALDWHLAMTGLAGDVQEIRRREYKTKDAKELNMRPLSLKHEISSLQEWRSYESFKNIIEHFLKPEWREKRNKVKALRDALRGGKDEVENFATLYRIKGELEDIEAYQNKGKFGWESDVCLWFDAIEMLDLFYPLEKLEENNEAQNDANTNASEEEQSE